MEVEIKLLLPPNGPKATLSQWPQFTKLSQRQQRHLGNIYFDTEELILRQKRMGLRIRTVNGQRELTLKTAGNVVGGLHARPEYNVAIAADKPDLALLPAGLFSADEIATVNDALVALFSTDFERQQGVLAVNGATVEVALDYGEIKAGTRSSAIAELELELIEGDPKALLPLIAELMRQQPLRLGLDSKAARGYRLAKLQAVDVESDWDGDCAAVLQAWQRNEQQLLAGNSNAAPLLAKAMGDATQWQTSEREWLNSAAAQIASAAEKSTHTDSLEVVAILLNDQRYGLAQLALLTSILTS